MSSFIDVTFFLQKISNLNMLTRQLGSNDFELYPPDSEGKRILQIKNFNRSSLAWIQFLPYLDEEQDSWYLYSEENRFVREFIYYETVIQTLEYQDAAEILGVKPSSMRSSMEQKLEKLKENFLENSLVEALF